MSDIKQAVDQSQTDIGSIIERGVEEYREKRVDQQLYEERLRKIETMSVAELGPLNGLAPSAEWHGSIGQENLTLEEKTIVRITVMECLTPAVSGGQRGCIDGRPYGESIALGPKSAGGTAGSARRLHHARVSLGDSESEFTTALDDEIGYDEENGYMPGTHSQSACGDAKTGQHDGFVIIAEQAPIIKEGVPAVCSALGVAFSPDAQARLTQSAQLYVDRKVNVDSLEAVTEKLQTVNPNACAELMLKHAEVYLALIEDADILLDHDKVNELLQKRLGRNINVFSKNVGYIRKRAVSLGSKLGQEYFQSDVSHDLATLSNITNGEVEILYLSSNAA